MLNDRPYMRRPSFRPVWSITTVLLIANVVAFILQNLIPKEFVWNYLALSVAGLKHGYVYQLITFQFLHGGLFHLLGNCFGIYIFGRIIEDIFGKKNYIWLYLLSGTVGGLLQLAFALVSPRHFGETGVVGASAGLFGLIAAFAMHSPNQLVGILLLPISFPAKYLLIGEAIIAVAGLADRSGNVAHAAHLGGMLTGVLFIKWMSRSHKAIVVWRPFRRAREKREFAKVTPLRQPWKPKVVESELPPEEFMAQEVDPILDKISAQGIQSLTDRERQILEAARKKMARK